MVRRFGTVALAAAALALPATARASSVVYLDFENIAAYPFGASDFVDNYYMGGAASNGVVGPNLGIQFPAASALVCLNTAGTSCSDTSRGGQGIPTSQLAAVAFPRSPRADSATVNVAAGFANGFSGVYTTPDTSGTTISIYAGINGTGALLARQVLAQTPRGACDQAISSGVSYCPFEPFSLSFAGTGRSVVFSTHLMQAVFDDFTFGSTTVGAAPEPSAWALLLLGLGGTGAMLRRRRATLALG